MCIRMYCICMYACMHICMYAPVYAWCVCMRGMHVRYVCMYVLLRMYMYVCAVYVCDICMYEWYV